MFILTFFLVMSLSQYITNAMMKIDDTSEDAYNYNQKDSFYIGITFLFAILLEICSRVSIPVIQPMIQKYYWFIILVYFIAVLILMMMLSEMRKQALIKKREELDMVWQIIKPLITSSKDAELDYNNPGFELGYKHGNTNSIKIFIEPTNFQGKKDLNSIMTPYLSQLDNFLPAFKWTFDLEHMSERYILFLGDDRPPLLAPWPGSWLRNFRFMPLGLSGKGEVAYTPDSVKDKINGRSQYKLENGEWAGRDKTLPSQPQGFVAGATGGGKSVLIQNVVIHCLEHYDKIALALVDPKMVEFSTYKGMKGIVGVANNTLEAVEVLRIARQVMYKRNKDLQKLGLKNIGEYRPHEKSGKVFITGREVDENEHIRVRIDGEEKTMLAKELVEYLKED